MPNQTRDFKLQTPNSEFTAVLTVNDIHAGYNKKEVLHGISLELKENEIVSLIGPNGAGKSTLLKVIIGILRQKKGSVLFKNKSLDGIFVDKRVKMGIIYLRQNRDIFPSLSVKENLEMGGFYLRKSESDEKIEEVMEFFPVIKDKLKRRAGLLSGGERRSLAIGMVLMKEPELLLLDEPTAGLAPETAKEIIRSINKISNKKKVTILFVEHNLSMIQDMIRRIMVMNQGVIVADNLSPEIIETAPEEIEKYFFE